MVPKTTVLNVSSEPVESKTRTYHGRVASERPAERPGGVGQDWVPTESFAQETKVHRSLQGTEEAKSYENRRRNKISS